MFTNFSSLPLPTVHHYIPSVSLQPFRTAATLLVRLSSKRIAHAMQENPRPVFLINTTMSSPEPANQPSGAAAPIPGIIDIVGIDDSGPHSTAPSDAAAPIPSIVGTYDTGPYAMAPWIERVGPPNSLAIAAYDPIFVICFRKKSRPQN